MKMQWLSTSFLLPPFLLTRPFVFFLPPVANFHGKNSRVYFAHLVFRLRWWVPPPNSKRQILLLLLLFSVNLLYGERELPLPKVTDNQFPLPLPFFEKPMEILLCVWLPRIT